MRKLLFVLFLTIPFLAYAGLKEERNLLVQLQTESTLQPAYVSELVSKGSTLPATYLRTLSHILRFDLNSTSHLKVVATTPDLEELTTDQELADTTNLPTWQGANIYYIIVPSIGADNALSIKLIGTYSNTSKSIHKIALNGQLESDRRQIHKVSDAIHKAIYNTEGIASKRILFTNKTVKTKDHEIAEVYEADYDGANVRQLTHEKTLTVSPFYLPPLPGRTPGTFFYVSYRAGVPKIHAASLQTGEGHRIVELRGNQLLPCISRQRDKLAFICDASGNPDLFLVPFDPEQGQTGKARQIFASTYATQGSPTFSPDGKKVAFVSNKDGLPRIYVMDIPEAAAKINQIKPQLLTKINRESTGPQWSPDGKKIAYQALIDGARQICTYDFSTNEETQLTKGKVGKENPAWAPNSTHIMYNSDGQLYLINALNPPPIQITQGAGEKRFPAWEP